MTSAKSPPTRALSMGLMAHEWTLIKTSLGESTKGLGIVWRERASVVLPWAVKQTAFMVALSGCAGMLGFLPMVMLILITFTLISALRFMIAMFLRALRLTLLFSPWEEIIQKKKVHAAGARLLASMYESV